MAEIGCEQLVELFQSCAFVYLILLCNQLITTLLVPLSWQRPDKDMRGLA